MRVALHARHRDDASHDLVAADLIGRGEHRNLRHRLVGLQAGLHLRRRDVLTRSADDVLHAIHKVERVVTAPAHGIAGVEPSAAPGLLGGVPVLEVSGEEAVARAFRSAPAHDQFAHCVWADLALKLVDYPGLENPHAAGRRRAC